MYGLIQLERRQKNAQPLGPHPFNMPEDDELRTLVATHISGINISSSPGFDTVKPTFTTCACKRMPKQNEGSWENVNVLIPHIATLFKERLLSVSPLILIVLLWTSGRPKPRR